MRTIRLEARKLLKKKKRPTKDNFLDNPDNHLYGSLESQLMKTIVLSYNNITGMDSKDIILSCHLKKNPVSTSVMGTENCKFKEFTGGRKTLENLV